MKIGFIGNANNYPFMLALAIRRLGHDVVFIVDREEPLHRPEFYTSKEASSTISIYDYPSVVKSFLDFIRPTKKIEEIESILSGCDALVVNGLWPILANKLKKPYVCLISGADLELYGDPVFHMKSYWNQLSSVNPIKRFFRALLAGYISRLQAKAISQSLCCSYFPKGIIKNGDRLLNNLNVRKRFSLIMGDTYRFHQAPLPENEIMRLFMVARHEWVTPLRPGITLLDQKGNDIFIRGLSIFAKRNNSPLLVVMVEKGSDVKASKKLISELRLDKYVKWVPEMSQKDVYEEYIKSDVVIDQLSLSVVGMGGLDAMAVGRPLLANGRPEIYRSIIGVDSPICQASNPEEVATQLEILLSKENRKMIADASRLYVEKYFSSDSAAEKCIEVFQNA